jgi:PAS domain S-box-containing protein
MLPAMNGNAPPPELDPVAARLAVLAWAFEGSGHLVFVANVERRVLFANAAARRAWNFQPNTAVAQLLPAAGNDGFEAALATATKTGAAVQFAWGEQGSAGARAWYNTTLSPLSVDGSVALYLCVAGDVTGLKRSEERLRRSEQLMVDTQGVAHLGTWEWDVSEPTATWSAELYRIYGLTPEVYTPTYEKYLELVHPDDRGRVMEATTRVFQEHVPYSHDERVFRPDGTMRYLHTWAHPVLDEAGKLVRLVGVCQDITEQKLAERQVALMNVDLERRVAERTRTIESSLRDLEAFNAMASHDLRAPLSVIQGSCELLLRQGGALPAAAAANLQRIQRSVTHMTALVNDLLALAQVGHAPLLRSEVDLSALAQEIIEQLRRAEPKRAVTVTIELGLTCVADPDLMRVVLSNLIGNAWKYSARVAQATIEVGVQGSARRVFFVRDNGAGFDMKDAHRLFAPFERLHSSKDFAGTGIGLAGTQRIIDRHEGQIWAEGAVGQGATFFFELGQPRSPSRPPAGPS